MIAFTAALQHFKLQDTVCSASLHNAMLVLLKGIVHPKITIAVMTFQSCMSLSSTEHQRISLAECLSCTLPYNESILKPGAVKLKKATIKADHVTSTTYSKPSEPI